jgi:hypothetical protein
MQGGARLFSLYSTVSLLAYRINQQYYGGKHFVWCAPAPSSDALVDTNPPSSCPWQIYQRFRDDIISNDKHSLLIDRNRKGLMRGATNKRSEGVISEADQKAIEAWALEADLAEFKPLFMVIPYSVVSEKGLVESVPHPDRTNRSSQEFIVQNLPRECFEVWS